MSNEELVAAIQSGATERMGELWERVSRLVVKSANRVMNALQSYGVEFDDLYQSGYLAMVEAVKSYDHAAGAAFSTWLTRHLKNAFAEAAGYRTKKGQLDPLNHALSMDMPLSDDANSAAFGDLIPDQDAAAAMEAVEEQEYQKQLRTALEIALDTIPEDYSELLRHRYFQGMTRTECSEAFDMQYAKVRRLEEKGLILLRRPKCAATLLQFCDFDFYRSTGISAFLRSGMSVQERYLILDEERQAAHKPA